MAINWNNLRSYNNSQNLAFEELCCQLTACEPSIPNSIFIRKETPGGGVECFWKLPSGDEWGWQTKFFQHLPTTNQWGQIDDAIKNTLEKHPRLTSYTICLPMFGSSKERPKFILRQMGRSYKKERLDEV